MAVPQLSVILPTFNRKEILLKTLEGFKRQTIPFDLVELLIVDDGSTDSTRSAVEEFAATSPIQVQYLAQKNQGSAAARNFGMREALGHVIVFIDDDIVPAPDMLKQHLDWHRKFPAENLAMLGLVVWSPDLHATPFMDWLGSHGPLFGFASLTPDEKVSFEYFYTCNVSVKREFITRNGSFNQNFLGSGYEDTEFSFRLTQQGMSLTYNPAALGYHTKAMSYADACRRQEGVYASWSRFEPTAAGQYLKSRLAQQKPPTLERRALLGAARILGPLLSPLTWLFDTQVRLPPIVYSLVYNFYVAPKAKVRFDRKRAPSQQGAKAASL